MLRPWLQEVAELITLLGAHPHQSHLCKALSEGAVTGPPRLQLAGPGVDLTQGQAPQACRGLECMKESGKMRQGPGLEEPWPTQGERRRELGGSRNCREEAWWAGALSPPGSLAPEGDRLS